ncbi:hypothetical protein P3S67_025659 [Capsicum chacoense]
MMSNIPYSSAGGSLMYAMVCTRPNLAYAVRRRSMSGHIVTLCSDSISWKASLQSIAALSTTEVEYFAATEGVKEATWLRGLILELGVSQDTTVVFSDSQSAIHLSNNDAYHSKTKHISVKYHYIRDTMTVGEILVKKVHTL